MQYLTFSHLSLPMYVLTMVLQNEIMFFDIALLSNLISKKTVMVSTSAALQRYKSISAVCEIAM